MNTSPLGFYNMSELSEGQGVCRGLAAATARLQASHGARGKVLSAEAFQGRGRGAGPDCPVPRLPASGTCFPRGDRGFFGQEASSGPVQSQAPTADRKSVV